MAQRNLHIQNIQFHQFITISKTTNLLKNPFSLQLEKIPTFYFFIDEKYVGRIVERPIKFSTLEEELLYILEEHFK